MGFNLSRIKLLSSLIDHGPLVVLFSNEITLLLLNFVTTAVAATAPDGGRDSVVDVTVKSLLIREQQIKCPVPSNLQAGLPMWHCCPHCAGL